MKPDTKPGQGLCRALVLLRWICCDARGRWAQHHAHITMVFKEKEQMQFLDSTRKAQRIAKSQERCGMVGRWARVDRAWGEERWATGQAHREATTPCSPPPPFWWALVNRRTPAWSNLPSAHAQLTRNHSHSAGEKTTDHLLPVLHRWPEAPPASCSHPTLLPLLLQRQLFSISSIFKGKPEGFFLTQLRWVLSQTGRALLFLAGQGCLLTPSHPALPRAWARTQAWQPRHRRLCALVVCPVSWPALTEWHTAFETALTKAADLLKSRLTRQIFENKDITV